MKIFAWVTCEVCDGTGKGALGVCQECLGFTEVQREVVKLTAEQRASARKAGEGR